jgi:hypothetical protein
MDTSECNVKGCSPRQLSCLPPRCPHSHSMLSPCVWFNWVCTVLADFGIDSESDTLPSESGASGGSSHDCPVEKWETAKVKHKDVATKWFLKNYMRGDGAVPDWTERANTKVGKGEMRHNPFIVKFNAMEWWEELNKMRAVPAALMAAVRRALTVSLFCCCVSLCTGPSSSHCVASRSCLCSLVRSSSKLPLWSVCSPWQGHSMT